MAPGRVVLTTGSNSGIGLAVALECARRGWQSVGTVRSEEKAAAVDRAAAAAGVTVETRLLDVTDAAGCARVIDEIRPDALVNNAGFPVTGAVEDIDDDQARAALEVMVVAPLRLARLALPHMRERGRGRIVNISSIYGRTTTPLTGWYQAAKHALEAVSDALRMEVDAAGVKVVLVEPGSFRTDLWADAERDLRGRDGSAYAEAYRRTLKTMRLARMIGGRPEQVARTVVAAIASPHPRARYLVGADAQAAAALTRITPTPVKDRVRRMLFGL